MKPAVIRNRINRMLLGALVWGVFYFYVFFDEAQWNKTLFGEWFSAHDYQLAYSFKLGFFVIAGYNFYRTTLGKSRAAFIINRLLITLIFCGLLALIIQGYFVQFESSYTHSGLIGLLVGDRSYYEGLIISDTTILIMLLARTFECLYFTFICIYLYQLYKVKASLPFMMQVRVFIVLAIYGYGMSLHPWDTTLVPLLLASITIVAALIVYVRSRHSVALMVLAVAFLVLL